MHLKMRGAGRVLGLDSMEHFLEQAEFCTQIWNLDVEYRMMDAHQLAAQPLDLLVALVRGVALQRRRRKWSRQCRTVAAVTRPRAPGCRQQDLRAILARGSAMERSHR